MALGVGLPAWGASEFERQVSLLFVGHSVTLPHFYGGNNRLYGSDGQLLSKAEPRYYTRDGIVETFSLKISRENEITMHAKRIDLLLDPEKGELDNVWTGDQVEIRVQLGPKPYDITVVSLSVWEWTIRRRKYWRDGSSGQANAGISFVLAMRAWFLRSPPCIKNLGAP